MAMIPARYFIVTSLLGMHLVVYPVFGVSPDKTRFPVFGIDVSHYQKKIHWDKVRKQKVSFAIIKATEGGDYRDKRFQHNWKLARQNGIATGAYHFFTFCRSGKAQALNYIKTVPRQTDSLPPVVDVEFLGKCNTRPPRIRVRQELQIYLRLVKQHFNKQPILYVTHESYNKYIKGHFLSHPIWIRDLKQRPQLSDQRKWLLWQYSNKGRLKGIPTPVDLNVFNGSPAELRKLTQ